MKSGKYSKLKIVWHPEKLLSFVKGEITAPIYIRLKPTNKCNHRCFFCVYNPSFSGIHDNIDTNDEISWEKMKEILEDFKEMGIKAVTLSGGGEPLVYKHIIPTLKRILEKKIKLSIITNGQLLEGEVARLLGHSSWIRISVDYCDEKIFSKTRQLPEKMFFQIKQNIRNFAKKKELGCSLGINFVIHEYNQHQIFEAAKFYKNLGADNIRFSAMWTKKFEEYHRSFRNEAIKQIDCAKRELSDESFEVGSSYSNYFEASGRNKRFYDRCLFLQVVPVIAADSKVYFCHNKAYDPTGCLGSIMNKRFKELWFSEEVAHTMKSFNPRKSCNHECANDEKNILYHEMISCYDPNVAGFP